MPAWTRVCLLLLGLLLPGAASATDFMLGADVSSLDEVRAAGGFADVEPLDALREAGFGWARLRLWHSPLDGRDGLASVLAHARELRAAGFRLLLNIHFSDTWADPGRQDTPAAWSGLTLPALADSLRAYTTAVTAAFAEENLGPELIQLGNEIDGGLLWPSGRVAGHDDAAGWSRLALLLKAAAAGARAAGPDSLQIVLHLAHGTDADHCRRFAMEMDLRGVDYQLLGLSYYPWWQGELPRLKAALSELRLNLDRGLIVAECAYPWTLQHADASHNVVGLEPQLHAGYPATPKGQAAFLRDLRELLDAQPRCRGLFYWEPAWIPGAEFPSPWENCALFDFEGGPLPALSALAGRRP